MTDSQISGDVIDHLASPSNPQAARALRQHRPNIAVSIQQTFDALFVDERGALDLGTRLACAARVAAVTGDAPLAAFYRDALAQRAAIPRQIAAQSAQNAALAYAALGAANPGACDKAALAHLRAAGLDDFDMVTLGQLIGYVAFQARVLLVVRALLNQTRAADPAYSPVPFERHDGFTANTLEWISWLTPVALESANPEQLAILDESGPTARTSPYYLTLVRNPAVLRHRSATYNAVMYAPGGLARADRELGALVVSTLNGCPYCASVHAQRLNQLTKQSDLVQRIFADPLEGGRTPREHALIRFARRLTLDSGAFGPSDVEALRAHALSDSDMLDYAHAVAIFAWANRLMQGLGEPVFPPAAGDEHG